MHHDLQSDDRIQVSIDDLDDEEVALAFEALCEAVADRLGPNFVIATANIATSPFYDVGDHQLH